DRRQSRRERKGVDAKTVGNHQWVGRDIQRIRSILEAYDGRRDVAGVANFRNRCIDALRTGKCLNLAHLATDRDIAAVAQDPDPAKTRDPLPQNLESLAGDVDLLIREAGDVAARPRQACDEAAADGIIRYSEYDRNERGGLHRRSDPAARGDVDIDFHADE